jgi:hypothetical protein
MQLVQPYLDPSTTMAPWPATVIAHLPCPGHLPIPIEQAGAELEAVALHHSLLDEQRRGDLRDGGYYLCYGPLRDLVLPTFEGTDVLAHPDQYTLWARVVPAEEP